MKARSIIYSAFCEKVVRPKYKFLVISDPIPRLYKDVHEKGQILPPGYKGHLLPDMLYDWLEEMKKVEKDPYLLFKQELHLPHLKQHQINELQKNIQFACKGFRDAFEKWLSDYLRLPLLVFALGGDSGWVFLLALLLNSDLITVEEREKYDNLVCTLTGSTLARFRQYMKGLENGFDQTGDFGFIKIYKKSPQFRHDCSLFIVSKTLHFHRDLYNWVCDKIYKHPSHSQIAESLFSKVDSMCHPNMKVDTVLSTLLSRDKPNFSFTEIEWRAARQDQPLGYGEYDYICSNLPPRKGPDSIIEYCRTCDAQWITQLGKKKSSALTTHRKKVHQHSCPLKQYGCQKAYLNKKDLSKHTNTPHRFKCGMELCGYRGSVRDLQAHHSLKHPGVVSPWVGVA